jgi:hypothetical protein
MELTNKIWSSGKEVFILQRIRIATRTSNKTAIEPKITRIRRTRARKIAGLIFVRGCRKVVGCVLIHSFSKNWRTTTKGLIGLDATIIGSGESLAGLLLTSAVNVWDYSVNVNFYSDVNFYYVDHRKSIFQLPSSRKTQFQLLSSPMTHFKILSSRKIEF